MPRLDVLRAMLAAFHDAGIVAAVGGSGLLAALRLTDRVRDWDITSDADRQTVQAALTVGRIRYTVLPTGDPPYATASRLRIDGGDHDVDVLIGFAALRGTEVIPLPTRVTGRWLGLPLADPQVWADAYRLIGRRDRAEALDRWLVDVSGGRGGQPR